MLEPLYLRESKNNYLITLGKDLSDYLTRLNMEEVRKANGGVLIVLSSATKQNEEYIRKNQN